MRVKGILFGKAWPAEMYQIPVTLLNGICLDACLYIAETI